MNKMNKEVLEQLLKNLAANVGYDLIPNPFEIPFAESSIENLPDAERLFWPVPASVLNDKEHLEFRKLCVKADVIDTVCVTQYAWPTEDEDKLAILLIDMSRRRRGCIKFVDAAKWNISEDNDMAAVCNLLIHDLFPGEELLAFQMGEDCMDVELDQAWNEQVCICAACDVENELESLHPNDYLYNLYSSAECNLCCVGEVLDIECPVDREQVAELKSPAILISVVGKLSPQIIEPGMDVKGIDFENKMLLAKEPYSRNGEFDFDHDLFCIEDEKIDFNVVLQQLKSEEVLRQLPITRRITYWDMCRVLLNTNGLYVKNNSKDGSNSAQKESDESEKTSEKS